MSARTAAGAAVSELREWFKPNSCWEDVREMFGHDRHYLFDGVPLWRRLLLVPVCMALHALAAIVEWIKP